MDEAETEVTDSNRPRGVMADAVFGRMLKLRGQLVALEKAAAAGNDGGGGGAGPGAARLDALRYHAATCGGSGRQPSMRKGPSKGKGWAWSRAGEAASAGAAAAAGAAERPSLETAFPDPALRREAMALLGGVQSLATDLSRAPSFRRRFGDVLRGFLASPAATSGGTKV